MQILYPIDQVWQVHGPGQARDFADDHYLTLRFVLGLSVDADTVGLVCRRPLAACNPIKP